jgi:hypothetical protein
MGICYPRNPLVKLKYRYLLRQTVARAIGLNDMGKRRGLTANIIHRRLAP